MLTVSGVEASYSTSNAPYRPIIRLTGSALNTIGEIRWSWSGPNSNSSTWRPGSAKWGGFSVSADGRSATVRPELVATGDPSGTYRWRVSFSGGGQQVDRSFVVHFNPSASASATAPPASARPVAAQPSPGKPAMPTGASPGRSTSPGSTINGTSVTISWDRVDGTDEYDFGIRDMSIDQLVVDRQTARTSYTARLKAGRTYRWNVRACNASGCSAFTRSQYFTLP